MIRKPSQVSILGFIWLISHLLAAPIAAQNETLPLEVDHIFIVVEPNASNAITLLEDSGIKVVPNVAKHTGQGTASKSVFFGGAYLELLWPDSTVVLEKENEHRDERIRASVCDEDDGPSPFGIGLRRTSTDSLPFPTTPYSASWMPEGAPPIEFIDTSQADGAIFLLIVPPYMAMSSWESDARKNAPDLFEHRLGIEKLSDVRVHTSEIPNHGYS